IFVRNSIQTVMMIRRPGTIVLILLFLFFSEVKASTYFVAPDGKDSNPGTKNDPWGTWGKAFSSAEAGDTVFFRGGIYLMDIQGGEGYTIVNSGTTGNKIYFWNYPGEVPILDCRYIIPTGTLNQAIHAFP